MSERMYELWHGTWVFEFYVCAVSLLSSLPFPSPTGPCADDEKRNDALDAQTTDWQNCNLYSIEIGLGGMGLWWNNPISGEWFSDRLFAGGAGCYQPGDVVGDTKDI